MPFLSCLPFSFSPMGSKRLRKTGNSSGSSLSFPKGRSPDTKLASSRAHHSLPTSGSAKKRPPLPRSNSSTSQLTGKRSSYSAGSTNARYSADIASLLKTAKKEDANGFLGRAFENAATIQDDEILAGKETEPST